MQTHAGLVMPMCLTAQGRLPTCKMQACETQALEAEEAALALSNQTRTKQHTTTRHTPLIHPASHDPIQHKQHIQTTPLHKYAKLELGGFVTSRMTAFAWALIILMLVDYRGQGASECCENKYKKTEQQHQQMHLYLQVGCVERYFSSR